MLQAGYMVPQPPIAVPEIGRGEEKKIQDTLDSYEKVAMDIARLKPDTILITSPHAVMYRDYFHISPGKGATGNFRQFNAGQVRFSEEYDVELVESIAREAERQHFPAGTMGELDRNLDHGTMVPLYFIEKEYQDFKLVRIGLSGLSLEDHWKLGQILRQVADQLDRKWIFIASGDLSHCQKKDGPYGYRPEGPAYDSQIMEVMGTGAFSRLKEFPEDLLQRSMECGHRSFTILGGAFDGLERETIPLTHEATFGVGYGFAIYHTKAEIDPLSRSHPQ